MSRACFFNTQGRGSCTHPISTFWFLPYRSFIFETSAPGSHGYYVHASICVYIHNMYNYIYIRIYIYNHISIHISMYLDIHILRYTHIHAPKKTIQKPSKKLRKPCQRAFLLRKAHFSGALRDRSIISVTLVSNSWGWVASPDGCWRPGHKENTIWEWS